MATRSGIAVWAVAASHCCSCTAALAPGMITWSRSPRWRLTARLSSMINSVRQIGSARRSVPLAVGAVCGGDRHPAPCPQPGADAPVGAVRGGWLAIEYLLTHPPGVVSVVLASTSASIPQFVAEAARLKAALPPAIYHTMQRYEAAGDFHHPDYEAAVLEFYKRHLCRLEPWPEPLRRSGRNMTGNAVYETMGGPNEFIVTGNLKDWDRIDRLGEITVPTLITVGRYDEIPPTCAETMHRRIPNAQLQVFEQTHIPLTWRRQRDISRWSPIS